MSAPPTRAYTNDRCATTQTTDSPQDPLEATGPHEEDEQDAIQGHVTTRPERYLAVTHWLLGAAKDRDQVRAQWEELGGIALLPCGGLFSAVRVPANLVWAAAGAQDLENVDVYLTNWFDGGAVFMDLHALLYYFLVPSSTAWRWPEREFPGVSCLGRNTYLGVPAVQLTQPKGSAYWCLPMDSAGDLCYVDEVEQLIKAGRANRTTQSPPTLRSASRSPRRT